jgi:ribosomal protein L44E
MDKQSRMELRRKNGYRDLPKPVEKYIGPEYAMSFVCFTCKTSNMRHFSVEPCRYPKTMECPVCKGLAVNLGRHFKPPKKSETAQWQKVKYLVDHGFVFQSIYEQRDDSGYYKISYPRSLAEAKEFVVKYKDKAVKIAL